MFDASPVTKQKVQLLDGRYGPYVTDGETNASLPKGTPVEELTFDEALDLLAARAAAGPRRRRRQRRKPAKARGRAEEIGDEAPHGKGRGEVVEEEGVAESAMLADGAAARHAIAR